MKKNHLTDYTLQEYLLNDTPDKAITTHIAACSMCRKRLEEYQILINSVGKIKPETFSFNVTSLVMKKINDAEAQKVRSNNNVLYTILWIISIVIVILLYPYIRGIFAQFRSKSIIENIFMLVTALGVVIFLLKDLIRQYKQKEVLLSQ